MGGAGLFGIVFDGLSSGAAAGLALAGAAALAGLYLLEPRRRAVVVAFAPLWFGDAGERRAERWARRLRRWLSLALQLAIFGLLLMAAAEPRPGVADGAGRSVVVLVDRSVSMSAVDEPGTRLGVARTRAKAVLDALDARDRALVTSFAADVAAESGFEACSDPGLGRLGRALDRITPTEEAGDLPRALAFAAAALAGRPHPTIVLVTDGAFTDDARAQVRWSDGAAPAPVSLAGVDVRWVPVGRRARNVAIVSFAARGLPADRTTVETVVTLRNFGAAPASVTLEIASGDPRRQVETLVERLAFTLAPGETVRHLVPEVAAPDARLEARLLEGDDLAADDRAYAVAPRPRRLRVLHVGERDLYLDGALLSLGESVALERVSPAAAAATRPRWRDFDAVLFDRVAPAPPPTEGHFLYLAPRGPGSPFVARGTLAAPVISDARRGHPLLRQLDLADVNIAEADRLALSPADVAVVSSFGAPLIVARDRPGLRIAALAFDVRRSDLPLRPAFPLLLSNALSWLAGEGARDALPATVGTTARAPVPAGAKHVTVVDPTGARSEWPVRGDFAEGAIAHAGFYLVGDVPLAANLADARESDTTPARTLVLGGRALPVFEARSRRPAFSLTTWALLAAAALLLLEWVTTNRRWTV